MAFLFNRWKKNSAFNPKGKNATIELWVGYKVRQVLLMLNIYTPVLQRKKIWQLIFCRDDVLRDERDLRWFEGWHFSILLKKLPNVWFGIRGIFWRKLKKSCLKACSRLAEWIYYEFIFHLFYFPFILFTRERVETLRKERNKLKKLKLKKYQTISMDILILLAECVLKSNISEHKWRYFKQLQVTAKENTFAPPYAFLFLGYLEENIFSFICW